jgi:hypothetical protein
MFPTPAIPSLFERSPIIKRSLSMLELIDSFVVQFRRYLPLAFTLACSVFALICYIFDSGPLLPPFPPSFDSLDCRSIHFQQYTTRYGAIDIQCSADTPVEFPQEYLPHFLHAWLHLGEQVIHYPRQHFVNMSLVNQTINLTITPPISGNLEIELKCLENEIVRFETAFTDVNLTIDDYHSVMLEQGANGTRFQTVCTEDDKILFFNQGGGYSKPIKFNGDDQLQFEFLGWLVTAYCSNKNITRTNETSFIIPPFDPIAWKSILFNLMPIANAIKANADGEFRKFNFFFKDLPPKGSTEIIKRFSVQNPSKLKPSACYKKLIVPDSRSRVPPDSSADIKRALISNFTSLRNTFPKNAVPQNKIVLADSISYLQSFFTETFPNWPVAILGSHYDVGKAADLVVTGNVLVGNHISNLVHMIWMKPNRSALIDLTPRNYACNRWVERFAVRNEIAYFDLDEDRSECRCMDFDCYPRGAGNRTVQFGKLKEAMEKAFEWVTRPTPEPSPFGWAAAATDWKVEKPQVPQPEWTMPGRMKH